MEENLWEKVAVKCLEKAEEILNAVEPDYYMRSGAHACIQIVKGLVDVALSIDAADREWKSSIDLDRKERMLLGLKETPTKIEISREALGNVLLDEIRRIKEEGGDTNGSQIKPGKRFDDISV